MARFADVDKSFRDVLAHDWAHRWTHDQPHHFV